MKDNLIVLGVGIFLIVIGFVGGFFYRKKSETPYLLQPLRDSIKSHELTIDSLRGLRIEDPLPQIKYKYIYITKKEKDEVERYKQLDTHIRFKYFHSWIDSLPNN